MERIQTLDAIEKEIIVCLQSAGNVKHNPLLDNHLLM